MRIKRGEKERRDLNTFWNEVVLRKAKSEEKKTKIDVCV